MITANPPLQSASLPSIAKSVAAYIKQALPSVHGMRRELQFKRYLFIVRYLPWLGLRWLIIGMPFSAEKQRNRSTNFKLLRPAETIDFNTPGKPYTADPFLRSCQYIVEGRTERSAIFTCEFRNAKFFPLNGLVFDSRWLSPVESILDHTRYFSFRKTFRPRALTRRTGVFSSIQHPWHYNNWHWTADSLPQVYSLAMHMQGQHLTLLMSKELGTVHRQSLEAILPDNFSVEYVEPLEWYELQTFVMPSHVSGRANAFFPPEFYEFIRSNTFRKLGTPKYDKPVGRYYISRARARHRRILNEAELSHALQPFGFKKIFMEDYTFPQQVELFRNAEAIVSPHGAALGGIVYAEHAKVCVFYPEQRPAGYFYTLARGVGLEHFCTNDHRREDDDFEVNLADLRRILTEDMRLR